LEERLGAQLAFDKYLLNPQEKLNSNVSLKTEMLNHKGVSVAKQQHKQKNRPVI
jgi:hypothetical protein